VRRQRVTEQLVSSVVDTMLAPYGLGRRSAAVKALNQHV